MSGEQKWEGQVVDPITHTPQAPEEPGKQFGRHTTLAPNDPGYAPTIHRGGAGE